MPESKEKLTSINIRIPQKLLDEALEIAEDIGINPGDAHRDFWIIGVQTMAERQNKVLVNKGLRKKNKKSLE